MLKKVKKQFFDAKIHIFEKRCSLRLQLVYELIPNLLGHPVQQTSSYCAHHVPLYGYLLTYPGSQCCVGNKPDIKANMAKDGLEGLDLLFKLVQKLELL